MYKLIWNKEIIERDIKDRETAVYLQKEYQIAYGGYVSIKKQLKGD